ncbi:MAG: tRNA (cytidine(34)-2'-O)-methyltransferase [Atopobiaceae bacterium]|jgi:tRNA (cytidine/uridine-2'-O-)-methyltransferase
MFNVVLVEPEIPANTGNIGRTCVLCGARLHLVGPMGFSLTEHELKRAGLAYWKSLDVVTYASWDAFVKKNTAVQACLSTSDGLGEDTAGPTVHLLTKSGERVYSDATYHEGDYLVFGKESAGLSRPLLAAHPNLCERIPMRGDDALLNAESWHANFDRLHPELKRDVCGNFVDPRTSVVASLNLSNSVAIVLYEAERQVGFTGMSL